MKITLKKFSLSTIAGLAVMLILAVLFHTVLMKEMFVLGEMQPPLIALGYLVFTLIMAYIYPIGYKGGSPVAEGLRFGLLMGVLFTFPREMVMYATGATQYTLKTIGVEIVWHLVEQGVGGIVIALVYGRLSVAPQSPQ